MTVQVMSIQFSLNGLYFFISKCASKIEAEEVVKNSSTIVHFEYIHFAPEDNISQRVQEFLARPAVNTAFEQINVIWDTQKVCLVPEEIFKVEDIHNYMLVNDMVSDKGFETIVSQPTDGVVALIYVAAGIEDILQKKFNCEVKHYHPIQTNIFRSVSMPTLELNLTATLAHLTVKVPDLKFAQTFPYSSLPDLLFYTKKITNTMPDIKLAILVSGYNAVAVEKQLSKYFKNSSTDKNLEVALKHTKCKNTPEINNLYYIANAHN